MRPRDDLDDGLGIEHATAAAAKFGMTKDEARQEWKEVAGWIAEWRSVFAECGVSGVDLDYLGDFLDSPESSRHREDAIAPSGSKDLDL